MKLLALMFALVPVASSPEPPLAGWAGEWHLDRDASRLRGEVIRIELTASGYRFDFGAVSFTLPDDGSFHSTVAGRETRLRRLNVGRWEREHRINGHIVDHSLLSISRDGRTLTIVGEHPGSAPEKLLREGVGSGLAGSWRSTRLGSQSADTIDVAVVGSNRLRWGSPTEGNWYVATVDGPPAANEGPSATPIATLQIVAASSGILQWTERLNGKAYRSGTDRLSDDGRVLTERRWPAADPNEYQLLVYRRLPS